MNSRYQSPKVWKISNAILFQIGWLACVLLRNEWALFFTVLFAGAHFWLCSTRLQDAVLVVSALALGFTQESIALHLEVYQLKENGAGITVGQVPLWLLQLWVLFALTLNHSLEWLFKSPLLACFGGLFVAPLSYLAGERLGVISLSANGYWGLGLLWCLALLILSGIQFASNQAIAQHRLRCRETI